jgi:hypothetical protein
VVSPALPHARRRRLRKLHEQQRREQLAAGADPDGGDLDVRNVGSDFFHFAGGGQTRDGRAAAPLASAAAAAESPSSSSSSSSAAQPTPIDAPCAYRYALSIPGYGYSSRLKTLLACGCVAWRPLQPSPLALCSAKQPLASHRATMAPRAPRAL